MSRWIMFSCLCRNSSATITYIEALTSSHFFRHAAENFFWERSAQFLLKRFEGAEVHVLHQE